MAYYSMWLFLWDDVIETKATESSTAPETPKVEWLHQKALEYAAFHLGIGDDAVEPSPSYKVLHSHQACCGAPPRRDEYLPTQELPERT